MSESFKKIVEQLTNPTKVYRNTFIKALPEGEDEPIRDTRVLAREEQGQQAAQNHREPQRTHAQSKRPSPWESKSSSEKIKILTELLAENKRRKKELLKTKEQLDEKSMLEALSTKEATLFTKVGDEISNLATHKDNVEKAIKELTDISGEE